MVPFVICFLMSLKSYGVLRFRVLTSHGALHWLCPDVPEILWRASFVSVRTRQKHNSLTHVAMVT